jgi:hypothetical protein
MAACPVSHSRILQIIPVPSPRWAVFFDSNKDTREPLFAQPIHAFALVEKWENHKGVSLRPSAQDDAYQVILPVTSYGGEIEPDDATNLVDIVLEWPLSDEEHRLLLLSARKS